MKKHIHKIKSHIIAHKIISAIIVAVIILVGYWGYKKFTNTDGDIRYITAKVERGAIVASISGSGQVSALNQIDIKSKVSGNVVYLPKNSGEWVSQGMLIAQLDTGDAQKSIRDRALDLESAKISLDKLKIEKSAENMNADLAQSFDDSFNTVSNVFLDLPGIMTGLNDMFFENNGSGGGWNVDWYEGQVGDGDRDKAKIFKQNFINSYNKAKNSYNINFDNYKIISRTADNATIEALILQTYDATKLISDAIKSANNYVDFVNSSMEKNNANTPAIITTHKASLSTYTSKTNTHLLNLLSTKTSVKNYQDAFLNSDLDIQSLALNLKQKENALEDAKDKLADYFIRAPFSGTLATLNIKNTDPVGANTVIGTLITQNKIAEISLNEVDVARIKIGQKTTLTFDAIPELSISGTVADIDAIGEVSQGVVTYIVKVSFDTQDERIKPGMSTSSVIVTDEKENVLLVPNSAIKKRSGGDEGSYVEEQVNSSRMIINKIDVKVGLVSDLQSEIISGIKEGDEIIIRTIMPTTGGATSAPSIFGNGGGNRNANGGSIKLQAR